MSRGTLPMHSQQSPGVVQNWSTLQCSKQNTEQCGYDHAPVTRGRMRAQFPLPHGPQAVPRRQCIRPPCSTFFPHICPSVGARFGPANGGVPVAPTGRVAMGDSVTADPRRPSNGGLQSGPPNSGVVYAAKWRTCPSVGCCSATGCACAPSAPSLPTGMGFWSKRSGTWPHEWEARRAAG